MQRFFFFFFFRRIATFITHEIEKFFFPNIRGECGPKEIRTLALLAATLTCNCKLHGGFTFRLMKFFFVVLLDPASPAPLLPR